MYLIYAKWVAINKLIGLKKISLNDWKEQHWNSLLAAIFLLTRLIDVTIYFIEQLIPLLLNETVNYKWFLCCLRKFGKTWRWAGGEKKINFKCWSSQFADKFNYFAWASNIHKILTCNINKGLTAVKQQTSINCVHILSHFLVPSIPPYSNYETEHHTFICYFENEKRAFELLYDSTSRKLILDR